MCRNQFKIQNLMKWFKSLRGFSLSTWFVSLIWITGAWSDSVQGGSACCDEHPWRARRFDGRGRRNGGRWGRGRPTSPIHLHHLIDWISKLSLFCFNQVMVRSPPIEWHTFQNKCWMSPIPSSTSKGLWNQVHVAWIRWLILREKRKLSWKK